MYKITIALSLLLICFPTQTAVYLSQIINKTPFKLTLQYYPPFLGQPSIKSETQLFQDLFCLPPSEEGWNHPKPKPKPKKESYLFVKKQSWALLHEIYIPKVNNERCLLQSGLNIIVDNHASIVLRFKNGKMEMIYTNKLSPPKVKTLKFKNFPDGQAYTLELIQKSCTPDIHLNILIKEDKLINL